MKCGNCGEKLNITLGKSVNFCSNCGNKITAQSSTTVIDNVESAFQYIAESFGVEALLGSKVVTIFADITRNQLADEKDLIKFLFDKGALDCLKEAIQKPISEQEISIKRAMAKLPKFLQNSDDADTMLRYFAVALGWQLSEPQPKVLRPYLKKQQLVVYPGVNRGAILNLLKLLTASDDIIEEQLGSIHRLSNNDWRVLAIENDKALLISVEILETHPYNEEEKDITWESCTLRKYLNNEFIKKLGDLEDHVAEIRNDNLDNPWYGTRGGNATTDKVFLLSLTEMCYYFGDSTASLKKKESTRNDSIVTDVNNATRIAKDTSDEACWWWLRSPGYLSNYATLVTDDGIVYVYGDSINNYSGGIRPALWLKLDS